jgi:Cu(I)/Ag(I) efflux system membrane protein CusA/SilA
MVGGIVTSFLLELTVYPALFALWKERRLGSVAAQPRGAAGDRGSA